MAKRITASKAIEEILRFVEESDDEEGDGLVDTDIAQLNGDEDEFVYAEEHIDLEEAVEEERQERRFRKQLTANRLVNSIDASLDIENYDPLELSPLVKTYTSVVRDRDANTADNITFTNVQPPTAGRQRRCDVIREPLSVRGIAKNKDTEIDCWKLFITDAMIENVVECTNSRISGVLEQCEELNDSGKYPYLKLTNKNEIDAFIALIYYRGLYNLTNISLHTLFSETKGLPMFAATMSRNRFQFLLSHLCFDDPTTRNERWQSDRFAAFRQFLEKFNDNCSRYLTPGPFLSIDETLYPMRHQIGFRQYNPDKPAKYGLLFKSLNSAGLPYLHRTVVYAGKPEGEPNKYYLKGTASYVKALVSDTQKFISLQGRNISMDRLYSSIPTAKWLLGKHITVVGTLQSNRTGIPKEIKEVKHREDLSTEIYWSEDNDLVLSSYVVKTKSSGKKNVLLLATLQPLLGITKDDGKRKPAQYKLYDFTKGGTDECDQRAESYCCKPKSRKWTIVSFCYVLDMARINASTILALNRNEAPRRSSLTSFDFCWNLVQSLACPFIASRPKNGLQRQIQLKIALVLGKDIVRPPVEAQQVIPGQRKRCRDCLESISGEGQKKRKDSLKKVSTVCGTCNNFICKEHYKSEFTCRKCVEQQLL